MTLHQLTLFLAVCNYGSLTEAAEAIHISQPSLSVAIKQLEDEFGIDLFFRYRKRLALTEEGKLFQQEAMKIVDSTSRLENYMRDIGRSVSRIHIGISAMSSLLFYPQLVAPFCNENPNIEVEMHELSAVDAVQQIVDHRLNLAIVNDSAITTGALKFSPLGSSQVVGCVRKDHPLANRRDVPFEKLAGEKLLFSGEKSITTSRILHALQEKNIEAKVFMYSHQFMLMLQVIEQFNAVGFFFEQLIEQQENFAPVYFETPLRYTHGLVYRKDIRLLRSEVRFARYCEAHSAAKPPQEAPDGNA